MGLLNMMPQPDNEAFAASSDLGQEICMAFGRRVKRSTQVLCRLSRKTEGKSLRDHHVRGESVHPVRKIDQCSR